MLHFLDLSVNMSENQVLNMTAETEALVVCVGVKRGVV